VVLGLEVAGEGEVAGKVEYASTKERKTSHFLL
jgi:hypothetical protein